MYFISVSRMLDIIYPLPLIGIGFIYIAAIFIIF
jgi:hypothetical protein